MTESEKRAYDRGLEDATRAVKVVIDNLNMTPQLERLYEKGRSDQKKAILSIIDSCRAKSVTVKGIPSSALQEKVEKAVLVQINLVIDYLKARIDDL